MLIRKIGFILFTAAFSAAAESPYPAEQIEFFETSIRPVLAEHCVECHSNQRAEADLRLDHREGALVGVEAGLLDAIRHEGGATPMPHKRDKLSGDAIAALETWVELGMPWPDKVAIVPGRDLRDHWSFKPLNPGVVPDDAEHPIDHFIHQQLQEKGLTPAPAADQYTLVRRLYFDLIGLPPTFDDQQRLANASAEEIIDELLASKHYGERWARHWMDVARYSDVRGYEAGGRERRFIYSYTYRDWLIRSLNGDMPYDQFVLYQLAAEQLAGEAEKEHWAALGFITLARGGRRNLEIDDQIDTTFRGLMGLTVSCSRCHDHKFDPIPTRDYYSIYGVFNNSVAPGEAPLIREPKDTKGYQEYLAGLAKVEKAVEDHRQPILTELRKKHPEIANHESQLEGKFTTEQRNELRRLRANVKKFIADSPNAPDRALIVRDRKPAAPSFIFVRGNPSARGDKVPARFLSAVVGDEAPEFKSGSGRLEMAKAIVDINNPLTARVIVNRVWTWHFGEGLVSTPSDFGHQGEKPSHPELLDWLANSFIENGWSLKKLHRLILTSETWRQSSSHPNADQQLLVDSENRLLWKANRKRLDFEQMRDSFLAVSGDLNPQLYGRSVRIEREPYPFRRSVYAFVDRQNLPELFKTFDFASPQAHTPKRAYTTIPTQALFTMNHPFMLRQSNRVIAEAGEGNADERIPKIYQSIFGREPTESELASGKAFIQAQIADLKTDPVRRNNQTTSAWQYGHGEFNTEAKNVTFIPFPKFDGKHKRWQAGAEYPLPNNPLSYSGLHQRGGHPGSGPNSAAIARWTAPEDAVVNVSGILERSSENGDPVRGRIVKNGQQLLKEAVCQPQSSEHTNLTDVEMKRGDTLDFIIDDFVNSSFDSFSWTPEVRSARGVKWNYSDDFGGPGKFASPWSIYAQALLATNEFVFVD